MKKKYFTERNTPVDTDVTEEDMLDFVEMLEDEMSQEIGPEDEMPIDEDVEEVVEVKLVDGTVFTLGVDEAERLTSRFSEMSMKELMMHRDILASAEHFEEGLKQLIDNVGDKHKKFGDTSIDTDLTDSDLEYE